MKYNETNEESVKYYEEQGKNRGGARKGAGRPKKDTKAVCLRLDKKTDYFLESLAYGLQCSKSEAVKFLLERYMKREV